MQETPPVTVALFAYNQEKYIARAVESILDQDYPHLQILISDDCSSDQTYTIANTLVEKYQGTHQVRCLRNDVNLGIGRHVNKLMGLADGQLIVAAAGDDISLPSRVSETVKFWLQTGKKTLSICSSMEMINEKGEHIQDLPKVKPSTFIDVLHFQARWMYGASHAWHKSLFDIFGPLRDDVVSEDKAIGFRSLLLGCDIGYIEKTLVKYRFHAANVTRGSTDSAKMEQKLSTFRSYADDMKEAISQKYLADDQQIRDEYKKLTDILESFQLRKIILNAKLLRAVFLLLTSGNTLTMEQKRNLLLKKLKR